MDQDDALTFGPAVAQAILSLKPSASCVTRPKAHSTSESCTGGRTILN